MSGALPLQKAAFKRISRRKRAYLREAVLNKKKAEVLCASQGTAGLICAKLSLKKEEVSGGFQGTKWLICTKLS